MHPLAGPCTANIGNARGAAFEQVIVFGRGAGGWKKFQPQSPVLRYFFISLASFWMRPVRPPKSGGFAGGVFGFATVVG